MLLRPLPVAETSVWAEQGESRLNPSGCRFGVDCGIEPLLRIVPRPPRLLRHATGIVPTLVVLCHFGIGMSRGLQEPLSPPPLPMHDALELALGMKDIELHLDGP